MSNIQTFNFQKHPFSILEQNGEPWFIAKHVCDILGLSNPSKAVSSLDDDEKGITQSYTLGGQQNTLIISESGLYTLIMRSDKPNAKPFRKWVTREVLPAIRKTGTYSINNNSLIEQNNLLMKIISLQDKVISLTQELEYSKSLPKYSPVSLNEKNEIIALYSQGIPKKAIARKLGRCPKTIRNHLKGVNHE